MNEKAIWFVIILVVVLACNSSLDPTITCGPSIVPARLWPTPIPYP